MKLFMTLVISLVASVSFAQESKTGSNSSTYSTPYYKTEASCLSDKTRKVKTTDGKVLAKICAEQYQECMYKGACVLESKSGQKLGLSYEKYDEIKNQSYFTKIDLEKCPYGYGKGRVSAKVAGVACLLPYFSASADPLKYKLGDVIFVQDLVGLNLPTGQVHDGFVVITDHATGYIDTGSRNFSFFTGFEDSKDKNNSFAAIGLSDPSTVFKFRKATAAETKKTQAKRGFKVLKTFEKTYEVPENPMLDQMMSEHQ